MYNINKINDEIRENKEKYISILDMINEKCPNGVEFRKIEDVVIIHDAKRKAITQKNRIKGKYPYYGANGVQDYVNDYIFDGTYILMGEDGSVITKNGMPILHYVSGKIWVNNHAHVLTAKDNMDLKYLYYALQEIDISNLVRGVPPKLNQQNLRGIEIPVPPLKIQYEIVKILDQFEELEKELEKELKMRIDQYEYYRDMLLSFDDGVEKKKLGEVVICKKGNQLNKDKLLKEGKYPVINGGINPSGYWNDYNTNKDTITISQGGASAGYVNWMKTNFWAGAHCYILENKNNNLLNYRYLYFFIKMKESELMDNQHGAGIPALALKIIQNLEIPIPSLEVQKSIAETLDQFDELCTSLTNGIPAEIEMRKEQYEYYRNLLLNFKNINEK